MSTRCTDSSKKIKCASFISRNISIVVIWRAFADFFCTPINKSISPRERAVSNCIVGTDQLLKTKIKQEKFAIIERVINYGQYWTEEKGQGLVIPTFMHKIQRKRRVDFEIWRNGWSFLLPAHFSAPFSFFPSRCSSLSHPISYKRP